LRQLFADASRESKMLNFAILSRNRELEEQRQITLVALPYLGVTAIILTVFMLATLFNYPLYKSQHIEVSCCSFIILYRNCKGEGSIRCG
jgi:hypothetical protein